MPRTSTRSLPSITLPLPAGLVTFSFPDFEDPSRPNHSMITIPSGSKWAPGAHWHEAYTEHVQVKKGRAKVTIGDVTRIYGAEDGALTFPKYTIHNFCRADEGKSTGEGGDSDDVVIEEWTDPEDGFKEVFFYNVMSIFHDCRNTGKPNVAEAIQLLTTIAYVDNYVQILPFRAIPFSVQWALCHSLYACGTFLGWTMGYKTWYEEYTPEQLWEVAARQGECRKVKDS